MDCKALLKKLTLKEKIMQLTQLSCMYFDKNEDGVLTGPMQNLKLSESDIYITGSVLNCFGVEKMMSMQKDYMENNPHGMPLIFMQDVIHGYRTIYPIQLGLGASFNMEMIKECSAMAAKEASVDGVHVTFAPMVDLVRDARWGRVMESTGEDTYLNCLASKAQVEGYQGDFGKHKIAACVKHIAAYGASEAGLDYNSVDMSERTLREYYLPAYKAGVDAGVEMVMTSFNIVDGIPSVANKHILKDILRDEWGFKGIIISDFRAVAELIVHGLTEDLKDACLRSIDAGTEIEMMSTAYMQHAEELIDEGKLTMEQIDQAVLHLLELKDKLGLFENPYRDADPELSKQIVLCAEHRDLARRMAEESAVLLKNDGVLPFDSNKIDTLAVIGPLADTGDIKGFWSYAGRSEDTIPVLTAFKNRLGEDRVKYAKGCSAVLTDNNESQIDQAVQVAKSCDAVVLCLGEIETDSGEANSKSNIELTEVQYKLLDAVMQVNKNVAVVLFTGRPLAIPRLDKTAPAILNMWMPGTEGGNAVANLVLGNVSPSGRLSMTFPASTGQCPIYYNHYNTGRPAPNREITYGYCASYIDGPTYPLYPFGYGLTYTDFEYSPLQLSLTEMTMDGKIEVSVTVKNVGDREAKEVVQMYIRDVAGSTVRPVKELKGFEKISLKAGESKEVKFTITADDLAFYGADLVRKAEKGKFYVFVGKDSDVAEYKEFTLI